MRMQVMYKVSWVWELAPEESAALIASVGVFLTAIAWPIAQVVYRGRRFKKLILRELEEVSPSPSSKIAGSEWGKHARQFVHRDIFRKPSENRDFILSLDPELVYLLSQLWYALEAKDAEQWIYYLKKLCNAGYSLSDEGTDAISAWEKLIESYDPNAFSRDANSIST